MRLSSYVIPGAVIGACVAAAPLCAVVASYDAYSRFERRPMVVTLKAPRVVGVRYTVTAYSHRCALPRDGRERAPRPAANGEWPIPGLTLAADWTLHPPGSVLIVGGRRWRVTDRGHDIRGRRLDLFFATCAEARIYGRRVVPVSVEGE